MGFVCVCFHLPVVFSFCPAVQGKTHATPIQLSGAIVHILQCEVMIMAYLISYNVNEME